MRRVARRAATRRPLPALQRWAQRRCFCAVPAREEGELETLLRQISLLEARLERVEGRPVAAACLKVADMTREQLLKQRKRDDFPESLEMAVERLFVEGGTQPVGFFKYLAMV